MKLIFIIFLLIITNITEAKKIIKMGYFELPPHSFTSKYKKATGSSIDYINQIFKKMNYEVKWIGPLPIPRYTKYLEEGTIDGGAMAAGWAKKICFLSNIPIFHSKPILAVRKDNPLKKINSIKDIMNYSIGWVTSHPYSKFIKINANFLKIERINGASWQLQHLKKLIIGRIDAVHDLNAYSLAYIASKNKFRNKIKILDLPEDGEKIYVVFSKKSPHGKKMLDQYNTASKKINIVYDNLLKFYTDIKIY